jgi:hypothetical protein
VGGETVAVPADADADREAAEAGTALEAVVDADEAPGAAAPDGAAEPATALGALIAPGVATLVASRRMFG